MPGRITLVVALLALQGCQGLSIPTDMEGSSFAYQCRVPMTQCTETGCFWAGDYYTKICSFNEAAARAQCTKTCALQFTLVVDSDGNLSAELPDSNPTGIPGAMVQCCGLDINAKLQELALPEIVIKTISFVYNYYCTSYAPSAQVWPDPHAKCPDNFIGSIGPGIAGFGTMGFGDGPAAPYVASAANIPGKYVSRGTMSGKFNGDAALKEGVFNFDLVRPCPGPGSCPFVLHSLVVKGDDFTLDGKPVTNANIYSSGFAMGTISPTGDFSIPAGALTLFLNFDAQDKHGSTRLNSTSPLVGKLDYSQASMRFSGQFTIQENSNSGVKPGELNLTLRFEGPITEQPPRADACKTASVNECNQHNGATVLLDGTASTDPDGASDLDSFLWTRLVGGPLPSFLAAGATASVFLPMGEHNVKLFLYDKEADLAADVVAIKVHDTSAPLITAATDPACLWPPNHKLVRFELGKHIKYQLTEACDPHPLIRIKNVVSSEPDDGRGDGKTAPDVFFGDAALCVRAERTGTGPGRQYSVELEAKDASGNVSTETVTIVVPRDQSTPGAPSCPELPESAFITDGNTLCAF